MRGNGEYMELVERGLEAIGVCSKEEKKKLSKCFEKKNSYSQIQS